MRLELDQCTAERFGKSDAANLPSYREHEGEGSNMAEWDYGLGLISWN